MRRAVWRLPFVLTLLLADAPSGALADGYTLSPIDVPFAGDHDTVATGINAGGPIVVAYTDLAGSHGFLYSSGVFSTINVPFAGARDTVATGINAGGQI